MSRRRHRELIAALPSVRSAIPGRSCIRGGGSDAEEIARIAAVSSSASHIFLAGRVDDAVLNKLYGAAYAFVMPSRQEGFGLVYLEAMNQALPCLACREDGAADVVVDGKTGILVGQPLIEQELVQALVPAAVRSGWRPSYGFGRLETPTCGVYGRGAPIAVFESVRPLLNKETNRRSKRPPVSRETFVGRLRARRLRKALAEWSAQYEHGQIAQRSLFASL